MGWGASMASTAGLILRAAPGSIPGRSSRDTATHRCEVVRGVLSSATYQTGRHTEAHEAPQ